VARGRKPAEIDLKELEKLCALQCTVDELAAFFDLDRTTILRRMKNKEFAALVQRGREKGKVSLRRAQMQAAQNGNATMLVWLGKQILGQKDITVNELSGRDGQPIQVSEHKQELISRISGLVERVRTDSDTERVN